MLPNGVLCVIYFVNLFSKILAFFIYLYYIHIKKQDKIMFLY
jgi:hypothetical protein